ncbi:nitrate- and nitrite sensing domain-containing protein [Streptomyces sp. NPDC005483]|uniref:sensor histidine kinase n=1 Tax=Streptomyces sp. NPDC005483 TaxID=3154882 RepID=UPI0033B22A6B
MTQRGWSMRRKFTIMLLFPLVSLAVLCAYAAYLSLGNALTLLHVDTIGNHLATPLGRTLVAVQHERRDAVVAAVSPSAAKDLAAGRKATDTALAAFRAEAGRGHVRAAENDKVRKGVDGAERSLDRLATIRKGVDAHTSSPNDVLAAYTSLTQSIGEALRAMTILPDEDAQDFGQALYTQVPAGDFLSQEDALISAAAATPQRRITPDTYHTLVQNIGAQRMLSAEAVARLPAAQRAPFLELSAPGGAMARVVALEDKIIASGPGAKRLPFAISDWRTAYDTTDEVTSSTALKDIKLVFTRTGPPAHRALAQLVIAGSLGVVSLLVSVVMSIRMVRSLLGDIGRLNTSSRTLSEDKLRDVAGRLRRGEQVDVRPGTDRPVFVNREMAELGAAFEALQRTAVELAEEDVRLHQGISQLFVNLARRSQVLINRQLSMLDVMERHEEDANTLDRLFELDQLATRMRRYAEGLLIVSGAAPGRFWRRPIPVVDVVRGGVAETEQYVRVVVLPVPEIGIQGRAAGDVIHLLAELIENAEVFSPSDSEVRVSAGLAATGLVIEIDDRGLGMPADQLAAANERIKAPLDVTALDSTRLGLVTVGRLAQRHKIEVTLRRSPYGGLNAVVLIPESLLEWSRSDQDGAPEAAAVDTARSARPSTPQPALGAAPQRAGEPAGAMSAPPAPRQIAAGRNGSPDPAASPGARQPSPGTGRHRPAPQRTTGSTASPAAATGAAPVPTARSTPLTTGALSTRSGGPAAHGHPWSGGRPPAAVPKPQAHVRTGANPPAAASTGPADRETAGAAAAGHPMPGSAGGPTVPWPDGDTIDGLPRRVPQTNLAGDPGGPDAEPQGHRLMDWGRPDHERRVGPGESPWRGGQYPAGQDRSAAPVPGRPAARALTRPAARTAGPSGELPADAAAAERPDRVRSMMTALQAGAARARVAQAEAGRSPPCRPGLPR